MKVINQYSFIIVGAVVLIGAGVLLLHRRPGWPQWLIFGTLVVGVVAAWIVVHPRATAQVLDAAQVQASIGQGTPVLLELQSPY